MAVAHHSDDQTETVLLNIARGTGLGGLKGMPDRRPLSPAVQLVRPLLNFCRADLEAFAAERCIPHAQDASNNSSEFARNRVRHQILPLLRESLNPGIDQALVRLDAALGREADAQQAALGFRQYFEAQQALVDVGAGSLLDLEQARRNALLAAAGLVNVQRERVASWITLYKSLGGGWTPDAATTVQLSDAASTDSSNRAAQ